MDTSQVLLLGLVNWLATTIVVDGVLFAGARARIERWARHGRPGGFAGAFNDLLETMNAVWTGRPVQRSWRGKVAYLVNCHLCAGVWIGLALALLAGGPFDVPLVGWVLAGLTYKAIGHLVLEVVAVLQNLASLRPADSAGSG